MSSLEPESPAPVPGEVAAGRSWLGERFDLLVRLVLGGAILLGLVGLAGLHLTRDPKHPTREV